MEKEMLNELLDLADRYPNDAELGKYIRIAIRKFRDKLNLEKKQETTNKK